MLSARHWDVTNLTQPIRPLFSPAVSLLALATLVGCAQSPPLAKGEPPATQVSAAVPTRPATPASSATAASVDASNDAMDDAVVQKLDPPAFTDHSFVSPMPPDLFVRLRAGFKLQDVDQPAVDR